LKPLRDTWHDMTSYIHIYENEILLCIILKYDRMKSTTSEVKPTTSSIKWEQSKNTRKISGSLCFALGAIKSTSIIINTGNNTSAATLVKKKTCCCPLPP
jgi:hypothetical protein